MSVKLNTLAQHLTWSVNLYMTSLLTRCLVGDALRKKVKYEDIETYYDDIFKDKSVISVVSKIEPQTLLFHIDDICERNDLKQFRKEMSIPSVNVDSDEIFIKFHKAITKHSLDLIMEHTEFESDKEKKSIYEKLKVLFDVDDDN